MARTRLVCAALLACAAAPALLLALDGRRMIMMSAGLHFGLVAIAAGVACVACGGLTLAGARARDGRAVLLGTAFSTMTALFAVHALATPGILVGPNGLIALAGGLSMPVGAGLLALTALPPLRRPRRLAPLLAFQGILGAGVLALGLFGLLEPSAVPAVPAAGSGPAILLVAFGLSCLTVLVYRSLRTAALTRRAADLVVALGCTWLGIAHVGQLLIGPMTLGFYLGHVLELAAVALVGIPAALDLRRAGASRPLVGDLAATEIVAAEEAYLGARVRALMVRLAERDRSTEQHTRRVALLAASVGEELRLSPTARRHLAVGGLMHDIGKLSVPLHVLRKPGPLDDQEFAAIKRHPGDGRRLLEQLGGFPGAVHALVSDHHERLDGSGYPRALTAEQMPIETRILAVCDVYDALVSERVYRAAWTSERALALLREESGTAFDGAVVAALERVLSARAGAPAWVLGMAGGAAAAARARTGGRPAAA